MISTGRLIYEYLDANDLTIKDLQEKSGLSIRTLYRVITSDNSKLPYEAAKGVNELIPELTVEFLMKYDAAYQVEKINLSRKYEIGPIEDVIRDYKLDKLFKGEKDKTQLFQKGIYIFGVDNIRNRFIDLNGLSYNFSKANNPDDWASKLWLKTAYEERINNNELLTFNEDVFNILFDKIKQLSSTKDVDSVLFNMKFICEQSGINFYYRPSIPNSRVKAVVVKNENGQIFILMSDLFKCVENLWLAFVHEMIHIKNKDYDKEDLVDNKEYENFIDESVIRFFIGDDKFNKDDCNIETISKIAKENMCPVSIVAEIARFVTNTYTDGDVNKLIHYYKEINITSIN